MDAAPPPTPPSPAPEQLGPEPFVPTLKGGSTAQDTASTPTPPRRRTLAARWRSVQRLPVTLMLASLLAGLGIVQLSFQLGLIAYRTTTWTQETNATQSRVQGLERDVRVLQDAERAASDPVYLEQLARCQGFVGAKETVVVSPAAPSTPSENCTARRLP
ncbi:cell division protein FtsB [Deinococcus sp. QL22]|uniref:cell division protein FtsB n=1 Tax=Deinococcus sp. QL22 TaxID=2939437 RepID=UPI002016DC08|nr:cell division protein FtsB [Deinococcus sp. QL22]UQN07338.1 cell division protein FtsB [Deinococcus sp. QL22]